MQKLEAFRSERPGFQKRSMVNHWNKLWKEMMTFPSLNTTLKDKLSAKPKY